MGHSGNRENKHRTGVLKDLRVDTNKKNGKETFKKILFQEKSAKFGNWNVEIYSTNTLRDFPFIWRSLLFKIKSQNLH